MSKQQDYPAALQPNKPELQATLDTLIDLSKQRCMMLSQLLSQQCHARLENSLRGNTQARMLKDCRVFNDLDLSRRLENTKCCNTKKCIGIDRFLQLKRPCVDPCPVIGPNSSAQALPTIAPIDRMRMMNSRPTVSQPSNNHSPDQTHSHPNSGVAMISQLVPV